MTLLKSLLLLLLPAAGTALADNPNYSENMDLAPSIFKRQFDDDYVTAPYAYCLCLTYQVGLLDNEGRPQSLYDDSSTANACTNLGGQMRASFSKHEPFNICISPSFSQTSWAQFQNACGQTLAGQNSAKCCPPDGKLCCTPYFASEPDCAV